MVNFEWHEFAGLTAGLIALGGAGFGLLRGFFQTKKGCESHQSACQKTQSACQKTICVKIDTLRDVMVEDRQVVQDHYAEIKGVLGRIHGKLNGWRDIEKRKSAREPNGN